MAVSSMNPDVQKLLFALGMPDRCTRFVVVANVNDVIKVRATYFPTIDSTAPITKRFELVEVKPKDAQRCR